MIADILGPIVLVVLLFGAALVILAMCKLQGQPEPSIFGGDIEGNGLDAIERPESPPTPIDPKQLADARDALRVKLERDERLRNTSL